MAPLVALGCTLSSGDVDQPDAAPIADAPVQAVDAAVSDAAPADAQAAGCVPADADTVAMVQMGTESRGVTPDSSGNHHATAVPDFAQVAGPAGCGLAFAAAGVRYLEIENSADFDLGTGSLDLYVRIPDAAGGLEQGIVSRDADGQLEDGHITVVIDTNLQIVLRIQDMLTESYLCAPAQTPGAWVRIGVNFGAPAVEMFVDGVLANEPTGMLFGTVRTCQSVTDIGIAGNTNPWVLGASGHLSLDGQATPVGLPLETAIDEFRVSSVRRDYTAE